ncbi:MAG: DegT/DnrJ/EryC1/StrS family aminotransferase [Myxococcota bacterium]
MAKDALAIHGGVKLRSQPWPRWPEFGAPERSALERVLTSGSWGGFPSPNHEARAFAEAFARFTGSDFAVTCANGTFSLMLALQAARVPPGSEVITSAYTFVGTAGGVLAAGCIPVLADVDPETYCVDPRAVEAAVTPRTAALMPVHLACGLADMDALAELARRRSLLLVEDCAHAHGAKWRGRGAGSLGDLGSFSMQSSKLLTAGEGGAVTTSDPTFAARLASLVNCGRKEPGADGFPEQMLGHNLRMTEWQAAVLRAQLERLPEQSARREQNLARFESELSRIPGLRPLRRDSRVTVRAAYQFVLRYDARAFAGVPRDHVILALRAEGIPCSGRFYTPLAEDPLFAPDPLTNAATRAGVGYDPSAFPVARRAAFDESIWLPHELFLGTESDVGDLVAALARVQQHAAELRAQPPAGPVSRR